MVAIVVAAAALTPAAAHAQDADAVLQAEALHEEGVRRFAAGEHREAAAAFNQAQWTAPNPLNLYNLARCYQELGEVATGLRWIDAYLATADLSIEDRAGGERLRAELRAAGAPTEPASASAGAPAAAAAGSAPATPPETSVRARGQRRLGGPWAVLGVGLALLAGGGVLDVLAYDRTGIVRQYDESDPHTFTSYAGYQEMLDESRALALGGDILVFAGAAVAVAGLVWLLVARQRRGSDAASDARVVAAVTRGAR
jgi:tetratricopeptide (TPR) repeat protein